MYWLKICTDPTWVLPGQLFPDPHKNAAPCHLTGMRLSFTANNALLAIP